MKHLNGETLCSIDIETTGLRPGWNDIIELAIVPLDHNIKPDPNIPPFHVFIKMQRRNNISTIAMSINKIDLGWLQNNGHDPETVISLFEDWHKKFIPKKIAPLGSNYMGFDRGFLNDFFGWDGEKSLWEMYCSHRARDIGPVAIAFNDISDFNMQGFPFPKLGLQNLASRFGCSTDRPHSALEDAFLCAEVYRRMVHLRTNAIGLDWSRMEGTTQ